MGDQSDITKVIASTRRAAKGPDYQVPAMAPMGPLPALTDASDGGSGAPAGRLWQRLKHALRNTRTRPLCDAALTLRGEQQQLQHLAAQQRDELAALQARQARDLEVLRANLGIATGDLAYRLDQYYEAFEETFRGSEEAIRDKQQPYLEIVQALPDTLGGLPVLDIGCGRGDWLSLLREAGIEAQGIDASSTQVAHCRSLGFTIDEGDCAAILSQRASASVAAISAFHIIEHLPFATLFVLMEEAHRVIAPGGLLILETPNPENVLVGSHTFYHDFSHRNPVTPTSLEFLLGYVGFADVEIRRLNPYDASAFVNEPTVAAERVTGHFYGPQDFAAIARRT